MAECSYSQAVRETLTAGMRRNPELLFVHEHPPGTAAHARADAAVQREFGSERVRGLASPAALANTAIGAALAGKPVILYLHSSETLLHAWPHLALSAMQHLPGQCPLPLVVWVHETLAAGTLLAASPGLAVAAPSTPADAAGLLRSVLRELPGPVVFLESPELGETRGDVPDEHAVPLGAAAVRRPGKDLTVVAYGRMAHLARAACEQAAGEHAVDAELIDLRTLKPFDEAALLESLKKTGRMLLCSSSPQTGNFVCEIAMRLNETGFDELDAPLHRLCAGDERYGIPPSGPETARIVNAICGLAQA